MSATPFDINSPDQVHESGCITNQIPYKFFRLGVENKGLLDTNGSMYIGTGEFNEATVLLDDGTSYICRIPKTEKLPMIDNVAAGDLLALQCYAVNGELKFRWVKIQANLNNN